MSFRPRSNSLTTKKAASYQSYFAKVLAKRLKYLNNINAFLAIIISVSLKLPYGKFWWNFLLTFILRGPLIFVALFTIKLARDNNTTVEFSPYKTLGLQVAKTLISRKFVFNSIFYGISTYIFTSIFIFQLPFTFDYYLLSKEYQQKPLVNDEWVYYWFYSFYLAIAYSAQHLIFQRNRLQFQYGITKVKPEDALLKKIPKLVGNTIVLNSIICLSGPIVYFLIRSFIYKLNWFVLVIIGLDSNIPKYRVSMKTVIQLSYVSAHIIFSWEVVNRVYNVYATIGCLDGSKPISTYSADPINTLLSGVRNVDPENQLSRLTAYQELAYISTTNDLEGVKLRNAIYNAHSRGGFIWPAILDECSLIIKETTLKINYRSGSDMNALKQNQISVKDDFRTSLKSSDEIFGNSFTLSPTPNSQSSPIPNMKKYDEQLENKQSININNIKYSPIYTFFELQIWTPIKTILSSHISFTTNETSKTYFHNFFANIINEVKKLYSEYRNHFLTTHIGVFFRITIKRDTESRVVNPVNYGNAVIAITNLVIHAIEEDKNSTISNNHISEILTLLERPIRASSNYTDLLPASVYLTQAQKRDKKLTKNHLIALLHDLTMNEFFQVCIKYNYKLNDLVLSSRAFKLAKWVIDVAIAQQQQKHKGKQGSALSMQL